MQTFRCVLVLIAAAIATGPTVATQSPLAPADIEKATGLRGVHLLAAGARGAVAGRDNYADGDGRIVLWLQTLDAAAFARAKAQPAKVVSGIPIEPKLFHSTVNGLGDEAFDSPDTAPQHALYVRKKNFAFGLISNVSLTNVPMVSMDQLKALAKVVLSRI
jgi:hypothetical protein